MTNYGEKAFPQPTTKRKVDREGADFYPTPFWATELLIQHEKFEGLIWEPACGDGAMSRVLIANGLEVISSDLYNRGYGASGVDFLTAEKPAGVKNIITNPPYNIAGPSKSEESKINNFVQRAYNQTENKFAFLLRIAFLESIERYESIYTKIPPTRVWVFTKRVTFYPKGAPKKGGGTTAYGWFVWDKREDIPKGTQLCWFPPYRKIDKPLTLESLGLLGKKNK